jgi:hypothetical protein
MPTSARYPDGRSQHFTFFRRELLQKLASVSLLHLVSPYQSALRLPSKYFSPKFHIGDTVADDWIDELGEEKIELGEIVGICWHPYRQVWVYLVSWTSGDCDTDYYPCFDENFYAGGQLRLANNV